MTTHTQDYHWDPLLLLVATDKVSSCFLCPNRFHIWCQMWMPMKGSPILVFLICDLNGLLHFGQQISNPEQEQIQNGRDGDNLKSSCNWQQFPRLGLNSHWFGHHFGSIHTCFMPLTHDCWLACTVSVNHQWILFLAVCPCCQFMWGLVAHEREAIQELQRHKSVIGRKCMTSEIANYC